MLQNDSGVLICYRMTLGFDLLQNDSGFFVMLQNASGVFDMLQNDWVFCYVTECLWGFDMLQNDSGF